MGKRKDLFYWNIPVTRPLNELVEKAITINAYVSKSDFIRTAVREKLNKIGLPPDKVPISVQKGEQRKAGGELDEERSRS
jgi:Arc/MetJ-type ribon-helix-helix transcriptional regulator